MAGGRRASEGCLPAAIGAELAFCVEVVDGARCDTKGKPAFYVG